MSEPEEREEIIKLIRELNEKIGQTLESHAAALALLNDNLLAAHKLAENHGAGIMCNREGLEGLVKLVNAQTRAFNVMREVVVKLWEDRFGPDAPSQVPPAIN